MVVLKLRKGNNNQLSIEVIRSSMVGTDLISLDWATEVLTIKNLVAQPWNGMKKTFLKRIIF